MYMLPRTTLLLLCLLLSDTVLSAKVTNPKRVPKNAVLLSKVSALTVRAGQKTTARRASAVPQLKCIGPSHICKLYQVDVMRCKNEGADYDQNNIQWSCKASLPEEFKLGTTDVSCEGYESKDDPYVLSGSCGVEYRLLLTEKGEQRYGSNKYWNFGSPDRSPDETAVNWPGRIFMVLFLGVLFLIIRSIFNSWWNGPRGPPNPRPRGGGFGWGGDDNDPPPPYDPRPPPRPKKATWSSGTRSAPSSSSRGQQQGWQPGFWTGTAAGAAAGYLAGRGGQTQTQPQRPDTRSSWFGGGGGGPSRTSSSSSSSGTRHESTGFGGTTRR